MISLICFLSSRENTVKYGLTFGLLWVLVAGCTDSPVGKSEAVDASSPRFDALVVNGTVYDGSGNPGYVADVAIIPKPDLEAKVAIMKYCLAAARSFGVTEPRVALIAATEKVNHRMKATVHAAKITEKARDGEFPGAIVDGPLALDVALSPEACAIKDLDSPVDGRADILIFPNIESGNVFYKSSTVLAGARVAASVVGTTAPCVLTSRADDEESKFFSIATLPSVMQNQT